jgi:CheY-like chemotaxis protein
LATIDELVERLEALEKKLQQYETAQKQVAARINEVNNLLAALKGHAQMARQRPSEENAMALVDVVLETVPRIQDAAQQIVLQAEESMAEGPLAPMASSPGDYKILLVDDEELIRTVLYDLLAKSGYNVEHVGNGTDAIAKCVENPFDLIFMDFWLGDMDGVMAMRKIREQIPGVRVIFMTGDPSIKEIQAIVQKEGADGFIIKPFDLSEIFTAVSRILQLAHL